MILCQLADHLHEKLACIMLTCVTVLDTFIFCNMDIWRLHSRPTQYTHSTPTHTCTRFEIIFLSRPAGGDFDQIRSNMAAILNFKMATAKQFMNGPIFFVDPNNVCAATKNIFPSYPVGSYTEKKFCTAAILDLNMAAAKKYLINPYLVVN